MAFGNYNQLSWSTLSESNNDFFTVQRSDDGRHWKDITTIKGKGYSSTKSTYSYNDFNYFSPLTYYRLKQTDFNGETTFSNIVSIENNTQSNIKLYPNPTSNVVNVSSLKSDILLIELYNQTGQLLLSKNVNNKFFKLNLSNYKNGIYILKTTHQNGNISYKKVVKN